MGSHVNLLKFNFQKRKIKDDKIVLCLCNDKNVKKKQDLNKGPLDLQSDALSTELSGLGRNPCQSLEIYVSKEKNQR